MEPFTVHFVSSGSNKNVFIDWNSCMTSPAVWGPPADSSQTHLFTCLTWYDLPVCCVRVNLEKINVQQRAQILFTSDVFVFFSVLLLLLLLLCFRVFVNRSLHMKKIKFFGFDMDYTLAGASCLIHFLTWCFVRVAYSLQCFFYTRLHSKKVCGV